LLAFFTVAVGFFSTLFGMNELTGLSRPKTGARSLSPLYHRSAFRHGALDEPSREATGIVGYAAQ
jgi:hypothetical protein